MWEGFDPILPEVLKFWTEILLFIHLAQKNSLHLDR